MRDYFRSRSTMQLPSTEYNFLPSTVDNIRQHLLHHSTSFIAFSKANNNPRSLLHNNRINKEYEEENMTSQTFLATEKRALDPAEIEEFYSTISA